MFKIINASAGTGKTFILVKEYLIKLISEGNTEFFKSMIALTFTNKAVNEMKHRIILNLSAFSNKNSISDSLLLYDMIKKELNYTDEKMQSKSKLILKKIIHQFSYFDIETLDKFTLRIIRSFSKDLNISSTFQVQLNSKIILEEVVDRILNRVGKEKFLTKLLERFSYSKMDELLSSDLKANLLAIGNLVLKEQNLNFITKIENNSLEKYYLIDLKLKKKQDKYFSSFSKICDEALQTILSNDLDYTDFKRSLLPNHFENLKQLKYPRIFKNNLEHNLINNIDIYNKSVDLKKKEKIDNLIPEFLKLFNLSKKKFAKFLFIKEIRKHWIPTSLIKIIKNEIDSVEKENGIILISKFNQIINKNILGFSAPFIYERLGGRYKHFFIDEFQDTSTLQWENLIPLISNSLENIDLNNKSGTLILVGDPKQSIYRWRGGNVNQFIRLLNNISPFQIQNELVNLKTNFRSLYEITNFNNIFFESVSNSILSDKNKNIFRSSTNQSSIKKGGYVQIEKIEKNQSNLNIDQIYAEKTIDKIKKVLNQNYNLNDIAILVRKKEQVSIISEILTLNNLPFISTESLLVSSSHQVKVIIAILELTLQESSSASKIILIDYFIANNNNKEQGEQYIFDMINYPMQIFFKKLKDDFDFYKFKSLSLYEAVDYAFYSLGFSIEIDACMNTFLDFVYKYSLEKSNSKNDFLNSWIKEKEDLYVTISEDINVIKVLTIHKSKGLEFPVVILPFMDEYLQPKVKDQVWFNTEKILGKNFPFTLMNFSENLKMFGNQGIKIYQDEFNLNQFDSIAVLYVSFTRAINEMYIITKEQNSKNNSYATLINHFIKSKNLVFKNGVVEFGNSSKIQNKINHIKSDNKLLINKKMFVLDQNMLGSDSENIFSTNNESKKKGIIIHEVLSKIDTKLDIDSVVNEFIEIGKINIQNKKKIILVLNILLNKPEIKDYFSHQYIIYKERDIVNSLGEKVRIDRLMLKNNNAIIMEYKTGIQKIQDVEQINKYEKFLNDTKLSVIKKILVYIKEDNVKINFV